MLNEVQASLGPYLGLVGDSPWLQALVVILGSLLLAWGSSFLYLALA